MHPHGESIVFGWTTREESQVVHMAHVLIVDDDEDIRLSMRAVLEDLGGHTVQEAFDGIDGLEQLHTSEDALVVLVDLLMPKLDGFGVLEAVSTDQRLASRHAFILNTVSRRAMTNRLPAAITVPVEILAKPFDMDGLLAAVAQAEQRLYDRPE